MSKKKKKKKKRKEKKKKEKKFCWNSCLIAYNIGCRMFLLIDAKGNQSLPILIKEEYTMNPLGVKISFPENWKVIHDQWSKKSQTHHLQCLENTKIRPHKNATMETISRFYWVASTVKPWYKDHIWEYAKVVFISREQNCGTTESILHFGLGIARWSLAKVWLYSILFKGTCRTLIINSTLSKVTFILSWYYHQSDIRIVSYSYNLKVFL